MRHMWEQLFLLWLSHLTILKFYQATIKKSFLKLFWIDNPTLLFLEKDKDYKSVTTTAVSMLVILLC